MYKQVTPEQLEIWLNDPVTKAYRECLEFLRTKVVMEGGSGKFIDPANNDLTCHNMAVSLGKQEAYAEALDPAQLLGDWERPEVVNA